MPEYKSRRSFFKTAAAGGALFASAPKARAQRKQYKRKSPASVEMIEVGIITCAYYSHIENIWGTYMNPPLEEYRGGFWPRTTGMVMTYVWDPDHEAAENFARRYDVKIAKNYYDMVDRVDAVILSDFYSTGWWPQLSKPYLEAGMPSLINRPFALSLNEAKEMIERSKKYDAPVFVPSPFETRHETERLRYNLTKMLDDGAHIIGAFAHQPCREYPAHGVHGIYNLHTVLEPEVTSVSLQTDTWWEFNSASMTWRCSQNDNPDYYATIQMAPSPGTLGWRMVLTSKGRLQEHLDRDTNLVYSQFKSHNYSTMFEFAKIVETRNMPQSYEFIMNKTTTFLTGFYSHREKNGSMVNCADLPDDWRAPEVMEDRMPDELFK